MHFSSTTKAVRQDIRPEMTVNEIIRLKPRTVDVFTRRGIDACCGGAHALAEVARRHHIDYDQLVDELARA